ncbi:MAG: methyltransferase [Rikenellaceae bacterium]
MFKFKQFSISQDKSSMKVGTDGVLIGAWVNVLKKDKFALDIGCGTGLIALMLAQRSAAVIDAVEIDRDSAEQASDNVAASDWSQRINIHNVDIANFKNQFKYDLIVSNPPFFNNSLLSPLSGRTTARHTVALSFETLINSVVQMLSHKGRFSLILPVVESNLFEEKAKGLLYLWRRTYVRGRVGSSCNRIMSEYRLYKPSETQLTELSIRGSFDNEYTTEYKNLTSEFYLKF